MRHLVERFSANLWNRVDLDCADEIQMFVTHDEKAAVQAF